MHRFILIVGAVAALLVSVGCGGGGGNGTKIEERTLIVGSQGSGANGYVYIPAGGATSVRTTTKTFQVSAFPRPSAAPASPGTQVTLRSRSGQQYSADVGYGGSFHCSGVPEGDYTLRVRGTVNGQQAEDTYYGAVDIARFATEPQVSVLIQCVNGCEGQAGLTDGLACTIHYLDGTTEFYLLLTNPATNGDRLFAFADTEAPVSGWDFHFISDPLWSGTYPVAIAAFIENEASSWLWADIVPGDWAGGAEPTGGIHWSAYQGGASGLVSGTVDGEINGWNIDDTGTAIGDSRVRVVGTFTVPVYEQTDAYWEEDSPDGW